MLTPAKSRRDFRFCTLAGVEDARLVNSPRFVEDPRLGDDPRPNKIVGRFKSVLNEFYGPPKRRLIEEFLNWSSDPQSVLRFTREYGPLKVEPVASAEFEVFRSLWQQDQRRLRLLWQRRRVFELSDAESTGGSLALGKGWLTYIAKNLFVYLYMDLVTCEAKRLRMCKRPNCPTPYFIASHLKQQFCNDVCAQWGQRELKKQWWVEHGTAWRQQRKESKLKKGGGKNVTRKTR